MVKTSTLIYSIQDLASKTYGQITPAEDLDSKKEFADIYQSLNKTPLVDVRQEVVNNILDMLDDI